MWRTWRPIFKWENLCPITFADPLGVIVVMPRAMQPATFDDVIAATPDYYPDVTCETLAHVLIVREPSYLAAPVSGMAARAPVCEQLE
jgi:hypothetical protein